MTVLPVLDLPLYTVS